MAREQAEEGRAIGRTLANLVVLVVVLGVLGFWAFLGVYQLSPQDSPIAIFRESAMHESQLKLNKRQEMLTSSLCGKLLMQQLVQKKL